MTIRNKATDQAWRDSDKGKLATKEYQQTEAYKESRRKYNKTDKGKETIRRTKYKQRYGITVDQYDQIFKNQNGACAICKKVSDKRLVVDHDHVTLEIRGLLCGNCNTALGLLGDDIEALQAAIDYLS